MVNSVNMGVFTLGERDEEIANENIFEKVTSKTHITQFRVCRGIMESCALAD